MFNFVTFLTNKGLGLLATCYEVEKEQSLYGELFWKGLLYQEDSLTSMEFFRYI